MADPHWDYNTLVLPFDGVDGSTSFIDESNIGNSLGAVGSAQIDTAQSKFGVSSLLVDASGDAVTASIANSGFGTYDWTIECWVRMRAGSSGTRGIFCKRGSTALFRHVVMFVTASDTIQCLATTTNALWQVNFTSTTALTDETWHHIAYVRKGNVFTLYIDGVADGTATVSGAIAEDGNGMGIGAVDTTGASSFDGWIDDFRVTVGVARYDGTFTPPVEPNPVYDLLSVDPRLVPYDPFYDNVSLLIPMDGVNASTTFLDEGPVGHIITANNGAQISTANPKFGQNGLFDGSSDISIPDDNSLDMGTSDFTLEMWVYWPTGSPNAAILYEKGGQSLSIFLGGSNELAAYASSTGSSWNILSDRRFVTGLPRDTWHHVALTREGSTFRTFFNGTLTTTTVSALAIQANTNTVNIGGKAGSTVAFNGRIDDFRLTKGVARYTTNFLPPPAPFRTQGLVLTVSYDIDLEAGAFTLTGGDLNDLRGYTVGLEGGTYSLSGGDLSSFPSQNILLESGTFSLTGGEARFPASFESAIALAHKEGEDTVDITQLDDGELVVNLTYGKMYVRDSEFNLRTVGGLYDASDLPRSDPNVSGAFWNNDGILTVSNG